MDIAILGSGEMGKWFARFFKNKGWNVTITDKDHNKALKIAEELDVAVEKSNKKAAQGSQIIMVSVPIQSTVPVIKEIKDSLEKDALLVEIASVKKKIVEKMKDLEIESELASIHPLFGPGSKNLEGQNIASIKIKTGERYDNFKKTLTDSGANVFEMKAEEHDRITATTQSLTHFTILSFLSSLDSMADLEKAQKLSTPMFQKLLNLSKAFLSEDPKICGDIQTENIYAEEAQTKAKEASESLASAIKDGNMEIIEKIFEKYREKIGMEEIKSTYEKIYENEDR